ncbi:hypothetical protein CEUSTIGMA_g396.t1 [Chlamydomonas eustigma]|uniref:Lipoyl-binding domain-containing protein n=1 Tax=Chlamydomonas eustigma TaxID=1157962 RepID=A0A250WQ68_9CHLO|nr:hypothetical protein CEUSTIGMA_g396.t1 [Chlamydomonas eustigma]|eukprot:GAX72941.1 hypothetical protein CEUSTIGMA_g396.t1 [Chlamydomonas eustigma]
MLLRMQKSAFRGTQRPSFQLPTTQRFKVCVRSISELDPETKADEEFQHDVPHPVVDTKQVGAFLSTLVTETSIAQLDLQIGSFELKVKRSLSGIGAGSAASAMAPTQSYPTVTVPSVAIAPALTSVDATVLESIDESLLPVMSPKVGIFRRGKYAGGKRVGKGNLVNEGDQIKRGQVLGFVEQLGTHFPVEAPQAGELAKFLVEDGAPIEYQQMVLELAPFFGGHIIGDQKHA